jgi:hypothetical protein
MQVMKFTNKKGFTNIPNVAFGFGTEYHMTADEMMVYSNLQLSKQIGLMETDVTVTMVDMLVATLNWETPSKPARAKKRVTDALEGLVSKGYIEIVCDGDMKKSVLTVTVKTDVKDAQAQTAVEWKENPFIWKGFTQLSTNEYNLANGNGQHLIVVDYTKWRENAKFDWKIAYKEWESILNVSHNTAVEIIKECESFVIKISGATYRNEQGQAKQEPNTYIVKDEKKVNIEKKEKEVKKQSYLEKFAEKVTDVRVKFDNDLLMQMFDSNTKINYRGYTAWLETECPVYKAEGEKKFTMLHYIRIRLPT